MSDVWVCQSCGSQERSRRGTMACQRCGWERPEKQKHDLDVFPMKGTELDGRPTRHRFYWAKLRDSGGNIEPVWVGGKGTIRQLRIQAGELAEKYEPHKVVLVAPCEPPERPKYCYSDLFNEMEGE